MVGRYRIAHADVYSPSLLKRCPPIQTNNIASGIEERASGVARVNRRIHLQAVGVFQNRAGGELVAMRARHDTGTDGRLEIGCQQKWVAGSKAKIAYLDQIAIRKCRIGKIVAAHQLDERHIASRIQPNKHGIVEPTVREPALHRHTGRLHYMKVCQRIAIGADEHTRTATGITRKNGHSRPRSSLNRVNSFLLGFQHRQRHIAPVREAFQPESQAAATDDLPKKTA